MNARIHTADNAHGTRNGRASERACVRACVRALLRTTGAMVSLGMRRAAASQVSFAGGTSEKARAQSGGRETESGGPASERERKQWCQVV